MNSPLVESYGNQGTVASIRRAGYIAGYCIVAFRSAKGRSFAERKTTLSLRRSLRLSHSTGSFRAHPRVLAFLCRSVTGPEIPGNKIENPIGQRKPALRFASVYPRYRLLALGAVAVLLGAGWLGVRTVRNNAARDAVSALQPVAPSVAPDPPERREALEIADRLLRDYPASPEALYVRGVLLARYGFNDEAVNTWQACLSCFRTLRLSASDSAWMPFSAAKASRRSNCCRKRFSWIRSPRSPVSAWAKP